MTLEPPCNVFLLLPSSLLPPLTAHCHYSIPQPPIPPPCNTHIRQQIVGMCWFPGKCAALSVPSLHYTPLHYILHPQLNTRMICDPSQAHYVYRVHPVMLLVASAIRIRVDTIRSLTQAGSQDTRSSCDTAYSLLIGATVQDPNFFFEKFFMKS